MEVVVEGSWWRMVVVLGLWWRDCGGGMEMVEVVVEEGWRWWRMGGRGMEVGEEGRWGGDGGGGGGM